MLFVLRRFLLFFLHRYALLLRRRDRVFFSLCRGIDAEFGVQRIVGIGLRMQLDLALEELGSRSGRIVTGRVRETESVAVSDPMRTSTAIVMMSANGNA